MGPERSPIFYLYLCLQLFALWYELYINSLLTLIAATNFVGNKLTFVQSFESLLNDSGLVHKNLLAILGNNKSVSFFRIEPFNFSVHIIY